MTARKHGVADALLSSLLVSYEKPEDLIGESGLLSQMSKLLIPKWRFIQGATSIISSVTSPAVPATGVAR